MINNNIIILAHIGGKLLLVGVNDGQWYWFVSFYNYGMTHCGRKNKELLAIISKPFLFWGRQLQMKGKYLWVHFPIDCMELLDVWEWIFVLTSQHTLNSWACVPERSSLSHVELGAGLRYSCLQYYDTVFISEADTHKLLERCDADTGLKSIPSFLDDKILCKLQWLQEGR